VAELEPQNTEVVVEESVTIVEVSRRPRKIYAGMWGPMEIAAVAIAGMVFTAALLMYFFLVLPSSRELARNRSEADRLEAEVSSAKTKYGEITSTQDQVTKVVNSIDDFETRFLPAMSNGNAALYQRLNALIQAYDLVNTSGPDYAPLETADQNQGEQSDSDKGRTKFRSLYPGTYVTTNLEGTYQNLRRFIHEIEAGNEFIVISTIELAPSDNDGKKKDNGAPNPEADTAPAGVANPGPRASFPNNPGGIGVPIQQPGFPNNPAGIRGGSQPVVSQPYGGQAAINRKTGKMHGELVSLHVELAAYFRRPNFAPTYGSIAK